LLSHAHLCGLLRSRTQFVPQVKSSVRDTERFLPLKGRTGIQSLKGAE
jgi:hypothetical protein